MLTRAEPIELPGGPTLYRDDSDAATFYVLPAHLGPAHRADGLAEVMLLFYQEDFAERGARLVLGLEPVFPDTSAWTRPLPHARVAGVPFRGGTLTLAWEGFTSAPCLLVATGQGQGMLRAELSLTREQAKQLRQLLEAGAESVRVRCWLAYDVARAPAAARARIQLQAVHAALQAVAGGELSGERLRSLLLTIPKTALRVESLAAGGGDLTVAEDDARIIAPLVATQLALPGRTEAEPLFERSQLTLRPADDVPAGELLVDFGRLQTWQEVWQGDWSLSAFYRATTAAGTEATYFPEVLALPAVGTVPLLVENLLPIDGHAIDQVVVRVRYRRLGSLEERVFTAEFGPDTRPTARVSIPRIAYTPFSYRYQVQVRLPDEGSGTRLVPTEGLLTWATGSAPILRIGRETAPFAFAFVQARPEVFAHVARVDLELAPTREAPAARPVTLTAASPYRWVALDPVQFAAGRLCWRPTLYADAQGTGPQVTGTWQEEGSLAATVTLVHVYPRQPLRIQAQALFGSIGEAQGVTCQLASGVMAPGSAGPADVTCQLVREEPQPVVLWPRSIFDQGFSFRYRVDVPGVDLGWTQWQHQTTLDVVMSVADDFYETHTLEVTLKAPWSERNGPDPASTEATLIFAELSLKIGQGASEQSTTFTFDKTNVGQAVRWRFRARRAARRVGLDLAVLTVDGRLLQLGQHETDKDRVAVEVFVVRVGGGEPAEFGVRWG